ncbi:MAG: phosphatase PAP2 family protein [Sphingobium sp.]
MATQLNNSGEAVGRAGAVRARGGRDTPIPLRWIVGAALAGLVALAVLMHLTGLTIALNGACAAFAVAVAALLSVRHAFRRAGPRPRPVISDSAEDSLLFIVISLTGAVASYGVAALTHGWVDDAMMRFDEAIGFDWNSLYALTAAHPALQIGGRVAYATIFASPAMLVLSFATHGQRDEARCFLASFWVAAILSLIAFRWLPTLGPLAYMWNGPVTYMPTSGLYQADLIPILREGRAVPIDLARLRGLVGPPSFHAASAVLYILAAWRTRNLRWPLTVVNGLMLLSIPVEGTHYAVDVISGAAVALTAHAVVRSVAGRRRMTMRGQEK